MKNSIFMVATNQVLVPPFLPFQMAVTFEIRNLLFFTDSTWDSSFPVEELYIYWLNMNIYIGVIVVTVRKIKDTCPKHFPFCVGPLL